MRRYKRVFRTLCKLCSQRVIVTIYDKEAAAALKQQVENCAYICSDHEKEVSDRA